MRTVCRFFLEGKCKFGTKCKYDHMRYTSLVDPPQWIYSSYRGLDMMEISPEEVRFAMMCGDTKEVLDNLWIKNYLVLSSELDALESDARVESATNRNVDLRKFPDVFMAPFDTDRVLGTIRQMREQKTTRQWGGGQQEKAQDGQWARGGYGQERGWKEKPRREFDGARRDWSGPKKSGEDEFDLDAQPKPRWEGRAPSGDRGGRRVENRQRREGDFIEEDFEYGKVPYSYRKPE